MYQEQSDVVYEAGAQNTIGVSFSLLSPLEWNQNIHTFNSLTHQSVYRKTVIVIRANLKSLLQPIALDLTSNTLLTLKYKQSKEKRKYWILKCQFSNKKTS